MISKILTWVLFLFAICLVETVNALTAKDCLTDFVYYESWTISAGGSNFFEPEALGLGAISLLLNDDELHLKKLKKDANATQYDFIESVDLSFARFKFPEREDIRFYPRYVDLIYDRNDTFQIFSQDQNLGARVAGFCGIEGREDS